MCHLQKLHEKYRDKGLVILGFNCSDDKAIALESMRENGATFPTILDTSEAATTTGFRDYRATGVPLNYIINRDGKVVDAWYGNEKGYKRALAAIEKAGLARSIRKGARREEFLEKGKAPEKGPPQETDNWSLEMVPDARGQKGCWRWSIMS